MTSYFYKGDCPYCASAFSVQWVKKIRKQICDQCGKDTRGQQIKKRPPPKTRKRYCRPSLKNDLRCLRQSQVGWKIQNYADYRIEIPRPPKKKTPVNFSRCDECQKYAHCTNLCNKAKKYVYRDTICKYPVLAPTVPDAEVGRASNSEMDPERAKNAPIDEIFFGTNGVEELVYLFIAGSIIDPDIEALYREELYDAFKKRVITRCVTPASQIKHSKSLWAIYLSFKRGMGVRQIGRRLELSPGYVSKIINLHRRVLENHLEKVFPIGTRRNYFYEKYFNQLTVRQISEKFGFSHQTVSKSIRRTSKKIIKSLQNPVASSQYLEGDFLFSQGVQKILVDR